MSEPSPAPAPAPTPAPAPAPTPAPAPWHALTEPEAVSYVENKGWKSPADIIKSYQGAEKLIGRDPATLVAVPKADDAAGTRALLAKLGLPESPDKYEFSPVPDGVPQDASYEAFARGAFHKAGLLPGQAKELTAAHNEYVKSILAKQASDYELAVAADRKALLTEWGGGHERMMNAAKTAAKALGFDEKMIDSIEREKGYAGTWKFFAELGKKLGEPGFADGKGGGFSNATMTPDEAKGKWDALKNDATWKAAASDPMHPDHQKAKKQQTDLFAIMYPGG